MSTPPGSFPDVIGANSRSPRALAVIPARLASSRLPRKPLHLLAGRTLLEWVWRRVVTTGLFEKVVVATDHPDVLEAGRRFGAPTEITDPTHPSGTDRVAEVVRRPAYRGFNVVVNVQGDEPFVSREQLDGALHILGAGDWQIGTVAAPISNTSEWMDAAVVKVVRDERGSAMLFSRAPVPHPRDAPPDFASSWYLRHIGVYAYTRDALLQWVDLPEHPLERIERLEQLRPLAGGLRIGVATVQATDGGVDTPEDAARAERRLRAEHPLHYGIS